MKPKLIYLVLMVLATSGAVGQVITPVPRDKRGRADAERRGIHDGNNIRTEFWNYGMVGNYPPSPLNVDLSVFHSVEVPKGSGMNYSDGITPFVLAKIRQRDSTDAYIMETGFRERQGRSPYSNDIMRFEPRPGYFQPDPGINLGRSPAISNDPRTWPASWPDKELDLDDPGWSGSWNGYFGKRAVADQETYTVMDDDYYDAWDYYPDNRDTTRRGLGLRVEVRGFQWTNPQASNVIFWHYDITNESTTDYNENVIFGLYMDSGVGGSALSCDGIAESDDDNAYFDRSSGLNLVYTWDTYGHGRSLSSSCFPAGYLGYAYLETPGKAFDLVDNDDDGITDERRDGGPGILIEGQAAILAAAAMQYDTAKFNAFYGSITESPAVLAGRWWTGDEDMDWDSVYHDVGADGLPATNDMGEGDGIPTAGEPNFDQTDLNESDQIGLTGFKMNRIRSLEGRPVDGVVFYTQEANWPERLYTQFTDPNPPARFDSAVVNNYNIGFLFASGTFTLRAGQTERFSLALAFGSDLQELRTTVQVVQAIYNANYQFALPPITPTVTAEAGDGYVQLSWDDVAERSFDQTAGENDFEGYRIYRSTDPEFRDPRIIVSGRGTSTIGHGKPIAQFDAVNGRSGYAEQTVEGVSYYLGSESGLTHTYRDTTVTNGQQYFYAVTSYDYGPPLYGAGGNLLFTYYPSESPISVSRTLRGGLILPQNVAAVRPNPRTLGYIRATVDTATRIGGRGSGTVSMEVVNSALVPDNHIFKIAFNTDPDSVHALSYSLIDSTADTVLFDSGDHFEGTRNGQSAAGLLPVISTPPVTSIDESRTGFTPSSQTSAQLRVKYRYNPAALEGMPLNRRRVGYPDDVTITFSDVTVDTSFGVPGFPAKPAKFRVMAQTPTGDIRLPFIFFDPNDDGNLTAGPLNEQIFILTGADTQLAVQRRTWRVVRSDTTSALPTVGDVFELKLIAPFGHGDEFVFTTTGERIDPALAKAQFREPYVVPNPYVGSASFEPERFAVSGRGDRRIEFRGLPQNCTIRIYTVRGDLVQTLRHEGSSEGYVPWNLRTKDNLDIAPGLYIFHVDAGNIGTYIGKFAIIK